VDVSDTPVDRFTETGIEVAAQEYPVDCIILATGFDAMTGALLSIDIRGREGLSLQDKWAAGPLTYLGLSVHGFPNLFTICGPGSPSVLSNMIPSIEQHVNWIADAIAHVNNSGLLAIESEAQAETDWVAYVNSIANMTLYPTCNSWYLGANVPGKPRVFMPHLGLPSYIEKCEDVVQKGYDGFRLY
jgi:cyclohexanone monooxygenase